MVQGYIVEKDTVNSYSLKKQLHNKTAIYESPFRLLLIIIFSVFTAEMLIMLLLSFYPSIPMRTLAALDAILLTVVVSPVLFFFGFRPLILHISERKRAEEITKHAYKELNQIFQTAKGSNSSSFRLRRWRPSGSLQAALPMTSIIS